MGFFKFKDLVIVAVEVLFNNLGFDFTLGVLLLVAKPTDAETPVWDDWEAMLEVLCFVSS